MSKTWKEISESYDFNRAALAKQRIANLRGSGKRVRGSAIANLLRSAGIREETEIDEELITQLDEVLSSDDSASKWIHDFVHSTNPKFEGKSKKERIKMALGAYYAKSRKQDGEGLSEAETKQTDDVPFDGPYTKGPKKDEFGNPVKNVAKFLAKRAMRKAAGQKPVKEEAEEIEQIDELKKSTLGSYIKKASHDATISRSIASDFEHMADKARKTSSKRSSKELADKYKSKSWKRKAGIGKAVDRLTNEEVDLDEATYAGLEKEDKPGKIKTAVVKTHPKAVESETVEGWKDEKKPVKEEYEEGALITMSKTFKQFMEGMTATQVKPGVTRYTGGSYGNAKGAKYGNTDYDKESLETKDDEGEEKVAAKRGPKTGSKRGPRTNLGSSKLHQK